MNSMHLKTPLSYWTHSYISPEHYVLFTRQVCEKNTILAARDIADYDAEFQFLVYLERIGRLIYFDGDKDLAGYRKTLKKLILDAFDIRHPGFSVEVISGLETKKINPFIVVMLDEYDALENISRYKHKGGILNHQHFDELVKKIHHRLQAEFKKQIADFDNGLQEQVISYLLYIRSLKIFHQPLQWIKITLSIEFNESQSYFDRLLLISKLSRSFPPKIKRNRSLFGSYVGYICSLNTFSIANPSADMIFFFQSSDTEFFAVNMQNKILDFWASLTKASNAFIFKFKCPCPAPYVRNITIFHPTGDFELPEPMVIWVIHLITRHQSLAPKIQTDKRIRLVTRGERIRRAKNLEFE